MAPPRIRKVFSGFAPDLQIDLKGPCTGQEPEKCLDWINRIKNVCNQAGHSLCQELMNKSELVVQNFIGTMGDTQTDEEVVEKILKYFSDIPMPAHAIMKLRALIQGEEEAIVTYNQKYRTLVERVERKLVEKIAFLRRAGTVSGKHNLAH